MGVRCPKDPSDPVEPIEFDKLRLNPPFCTHILQKKFTFNTNTWVETSYETHQNNTNKAPKKSAGCESAGTETAGKEDSL